MAELTTRLPAQVASSKSTGWVFTLHIIRARGSISKPTARLPHRKASTIAVPLPIMGSMTVSPFDSESLDKNPRQLWRELRRKSVQSVAGVITCVSMKVKVRGEKL